MCARKKNIEKHKILQTRRNKDNIYDLYEIEASRFVRVKQMIYDGG